MILIISIYLKDESFIFEKHKDNVLLRSGKNNIFFKTEVWMCQFLLKWQTLRSSVQAEGLKQSGKRITLASLTYEIPWQAGTYVLFPSGLAYPVVLRPNRDDQGFSCLLVTFVL